MFFSSLARSSLASARATRRCSLSASTTPIRSNNKCLLSASSSSDKSFSSPVPSCSSLRLIQFPKQLDLFGAPAIDSPFDAT
ncbi:hypothetical protein PF004_g6042 [Phytophthora fragariae]|uniref:Uncharacterized protein n=1 Tax=Phytophthora fragariae TaxID=53985 RepID=A0A6G0PE12_9STRA|nr:hypothetical protein PF004_g6042 [Phytophthora fragariae]